MTQLLLLSAVLLLLIWLLVRTRRNTSEPTRGRTRQRTAPSGNSAFHAVSLRYNPNSCQAARDLDGQRFLATAAPRIPLPGCDAAECNCRFTHHKDRRHGQERRNPFGSPGVDGATGRFKKERRQGGDRRKGDDSKSTG